MRFFYSDGRDKKGPFTIDELGEEDIEMDTLVWHEGLDDWEVARNIPDLKSILEHRPPPVPESGSGARSSTSKSAQPGSPSVDLSHSERATTASATSMFSNIFSFEGRIRRMEYGISFLVYIVISAVVNAIVSAGEAPILGIAYIPMLWVLWAQGAKRCHDLGKSGWFQVIPFYPLWMIFADGKREVNKYGPSPKS